MTTTTEEYVCAQTKTQDLEEEAMNCILSKYFVGLRVPTESNIIAWWTSGHLVLILLDFREKGAIWLLAVVYFWEPDSYPVKTNVSADVSSTLQCSLLR